MTKRDRSPHTHRVHLSFFFVIDPNRYLHVPFELSMSGVYVQIANKRTASKGRRAGAIKYFM